MFRTLLSMAAAISLAGVFPQSSSAETVSKQVSVSVHYGDLNLATDAGAKTLLKRLNWAGRQVCGRRPPMGSITLYEQQRACMREAISTAVATLGSRAVTAQLTAQNYKTTASR